MSPVSSSARNYKPLFAIMTCDGIDTESLGDNARRIIE